MVSTRGTASKLRQSKLNFESTPGTQSSPIRTTSTRARKKIPTSNSQRAATVKPRSNFLGTTGRSRQTYFVDSSDDDLHAPVRPATDPVDSENLMATQRGGKAVFVYDETDSDEDDDSPVPTSSIRKRKRPGPAISDSSEEEKPSQSEEDEELTRTAKARKVARVVDEEDDLAEDLAYLDSSPPAITPRSTKSKTSERAKALEELKRKREKRKSKASPGRKRLVVMDSDDELLEVSGESDEYDEQAGSEAEDDGEEDVDAFEVFDEHEADRDFIASDDDEEFTLGVPTNLPIEFSSWSTAKPRELFRFAVQWFVHKRINPAFARNDGIYELTWKKLNDEITGLAGSKFTSSAWTRDFTYALQSRPSMKTSRIEYDGSDCEACGRSGHPATFQIQFTGAPYDGTYEDVEQRPEDVGNVTRDRHGNIIPPEERTYVMGKTCFGNAKMAHRLKHWRCSLGEWVLSYLNDIEELTPAKIVERDGWKEAKRRDHADTIVERMVEDGEVQQLYKAMKDEVSVARGSEDWA